VAAVKIFAALFFETSLRENKEISHHEK